MNASRPAESSAGEVYEVFAKKNPDDTLHHIGTVIAPDVALAQVYAFTIYQEWAWDEMIIVPRHRIGQSDGVSEYLILAQKSYEQPLELLGLLHVEGGAEVHEDQLVEQARGQFGTEDWIELIAIPQSAVIQVIPNTESLRSTP
jgi:hypothetical protein